MALAWLGESLVCGGAGADTWFSQAAELGCDSDLSYVAALGLLGLGRIALDSGDTDRHRNRLRDHGRPVAGNYDGNGTVECSDRSTA
jgi:hypothetical protein